MPEGKKHEKLLYDYDYRPLLAVLILFTPNFIPRMAVEIKSLTISDDSRPMILFQKFGFTQLDTLASLFPPYQ
ncbi:unnamed protein product [Microthlaspi erraticum]|uniref:CAND6/7 N-terminal domain-containing protein n=1 Tax=Microthlaspi erraticum TaxID=1685480 RepID=A0A6D2K6I7_9BRAS|nr:unnamed protein product [Microthlaspi erraticum]